MAITQRYLTIANGHMILTGNALMLYQANVANGGPFTTVDTSLQVPGYPAGTTLDWQQNSSMAVLTVPPTATVLYAELTWSSLLIAGAVNYSAFANDPVNFMTPASPVPVPVAVQYSDVTNNISTRSADVTALVQAGGSGQYTLGRIAGVNGIESTGITGNAAGWYLSVIVEDQTESSKLFQINVGNVFVPGQSSVDFSISGFSTPASGPVTGRLFAGIQRGDPVADDITIFTGPSTAALNYQLSRPPMPDNNMIAGFISDTETGAIIDTSGTFGNNNNIPGNPPVAQPFARWHIDIAAFDVSPSLTNNQTTFVTRSISNAPVAVFDFNVFNLQIDAQSAFITTEKTVDLAFAQPGDTITYTIIATNNGNIMADDVIVTDTPPAGTTFVPGSVVVNGNPLPAEDITAGVNIGSVPANGELSIITFQALVDTLPTPNPMINTADVSYTFVPLPGEEPISGLSTSTEAQTQVNEANVEVVKTAAPDATGVDGIITYTLTLQNTGNVAADNVTITDAIPAGTTFVPGSVTGASGTPPTLTLTSPIAAGGSAVVTFQVQIDGTIPDPNPVPNSAAADYSFTVNPAEPNGASASAQSNTVATPVNDAAITILKTVDQEFAIPGEILTYTLTLENTGNVAANNIVLTDAVPAGTTFVPGSVTGATGVPPTLTLLAPISAGSSAVVTFQVQVDAAIPDPNPISNLATADFTFTVDPQNPDGASGNSNSNLATTTINVADITTVKTVDKAFADAGDVLTYTFTLENTGNVAANNVTITDAVPAGTTFIAGSVIGATGQPPILSLQNPIPAGGNATVSFQVQVGDTIPVPNPVLNSATTDFTFTVDPAVPDGESGTGTSNTVETQVNSALIATSKTVDPAFSDVGEVLTYTLTIENSGNVSANNVVITDPLPAGTSFVSGSLTGATGQPPTLTLAAPIPAGGSSVVTYQVALGAGIPNPNPVENSFSTTFYYTVDPANPNGATGTLTSNTVTTQVNTANLNIVKRADKNISYLGDTITYQIAVTNTGNVPAANVVLTDTLTSGVSYVPGSLIVSAPYTGDPTTAITLTNPIAPGQTVTLSFQVTVMAIPNPNPVKNLIRADFNYTVDPENPDGVSSSSNSNTVMTLVFRYDYGQEITDLITSVANEQAALAAIANAEGAKIQKIVASGTATSQELLCLNQSVSDMLDSIAMLEHVLRQKLSIVSCQINEMNGTCISL